MIRKQIHITEQQDEKLQKLIDETGLKQSELFRRALDGLIHNRTDWWNQIPRTVGDITEQIQKNIDAKSTGNDTN